MKRQLLTQLDIFVGQLVEKICNSAFRDAVFHRENGVNGFDDVADGGIVVEHGNPPSLLLPITVKSYANLLSSENVRKSWEPGKVYVSKVNRPKKDSESILIQLLLPTLTSLTSNSYWNFVAIRKSP